MLIGFFSKQFVLYSAIENGYNFMSFVCILVSVISASYYLKIIKVLMHEPIFSDREQLKNYGPAASEKSKQAPILLGEQNNTFILSNYHSFLISTLTLAILLFIFKSSLILNSTQLLSLSLFNF
jgi:NADH-ubiquinone oxidoreductase chain 2